MHGIEVAERNVQGSKIILVANFLSRIHPYNGWENLDMYSN